MITAKSLLITTDTTVVFGPFSEGDHWDNVGLLYGDSQGCYFRFGLANRPATASQWSVNVLPLSEELDGTGTVPGLPMVSNGIAGLPYGFASFPVNYQFDRLRPYAVVWIRPIAASAPCGVFVGVRPGSLRGRQYHGKGSNIPVGRQYD